MPLQLREILTITLQMQPERTPPLQFRTPQPDQLLQQQFKLQLMNLMEML